MDSPLVSLWFTVRGAAGDGGQTRGWPAQHQAGDLWDQPRDPEAEIWDWPRQEAGTVGTMEEKSILSFLDHQVSSTIMWEILGHWGKSRERRTCHGWVSPGWRDGAQLKSRKQTQDRTNLSRSVFHTHSLEASKWDSIRRMIELGMQDTCWQRKAQARKCGGRMLQIYSYSMWKRIWEKTQDKWGLFKKICEVKGRWGLKSLR